MRGEIQRTFDGGSYETKSSEMLWRQWDWANGERYPDLKMPDVKFARVLFEKKGL
jgi:hypothetical protein